MDVTVDAMHGVSCQLGGGGAALEVRATGHPSGHRLCVFLRSDSRKLSAVSQEAVPCPLRRRYATPDVEFCGCLKPEHLPKSVELPVLVRFLCWSSLMKRDAWRRLGRMKHPLASQFAVLDRYRLLRRFPPLPWRQRSGASGNRVREASSSGALELTPSARNAASRAPGGAQRRRKVPLRRFVHGGWSGEGEQRVRRAKKNKAVSITATAFSHAGEGRGCVVPGTSAVRLALAQSPAGVVESAKTSVSVPLVRRCFRPRVRRLTSFNPVALHLVTLAHHPPRNRLPLRNSAHTTPGVSGECRCLRRPATEGVCRGQLCSEGWAPSVGAGRAPVASGFKSATMLTAGTLHRGLRLASPGPIMVCCPALQSCP